VFATSSLSFGSEQKKILIGDEFFRGYIRLRTEAQKCEALEVKDRLRVSLSSNLRFQSKRQVIDEISEEEVDELPIHST